MAAQFNPDSDWRRVATAIYQKPVDSKIFGTVELDVTDLEAYVAQKRKEGLKITLMHPLILILARGLKYEVPELNCYVVRGRIVQRDYVDVMVSVLQRDSEQLGSVRVPDADKMTLSELAVWLAEGVSSARGGREKGTTTQKSTLARLPWPLRGWMVRLARKMVVDWGFSLPFLDYTPHSFGSFVFSNVGSIGLDIAYPALMPVSNLAMVVTMGGVQSKPAVVGDQIVPRRMLVMSAAIDHRIADALHGGKLFRFLKQAIKRPGLLE